MVDRSESPMLEGPDTSDGSSIAASASKKVERARLWRNRNIAGVELFHGDFLNYSFARHFHSVVAFGAVESGNLRSWHRHAEYAVGPNALMMFNPGEVHAPLAADPRRWSFRMFYLQDDLFANLSWQVAGRPIRFSSPFGSDPAVSRRLLELHRELEEKCETIEFECRMLQILEEIAGRHSVSRGTRTPAAVPASVSRMREYIHAYAEQQMSLSVLADVGHLSPYHALRSFRDVLGLPPHRYLLQVRVERAKQLLQQGKTIAETAVLLGFADQSHLNRHYKRIFGVTPAESLHCVP